MDLSERRANCARHPWEIARSSFFRRLVAGAVEIGHVERLLDVGGGDGWFAHELLDDLAPAASVTCWDINYTADDLDSALPARVVRTTERPDGVFQVVLLMDVLEHVEDDRGFLRDTVVPLLGANGTLIVSVPTHPALFSAHDAMLGHYRRYRPAEIQQLLSRNLRIARDGSLFTSLVGPRALQVGVEKVRGERAGERDGIGGWTHGALITKALSTALTVDAGIGLALSRHGRRLPGLSYWAVCRPDR